MSGPHSPGETVRALWERVQARDWEGAEALLGEELVVDWPHTNERIRGRENVIELNRNYPEPWDIEVRSIVAEGERVAAEVAVAHPGGTALAAGFYLVEDGKIQRASEYWVEQGHDKAPSWRARWVERLQP